MESMLGKVARAAGDSAHAGSGRLPERAAPSAPAPPQAIDKNKSSFCTEPCSQPCAAIAPQHLRGTITRGAEHITKNISPGSPPSTQNNTHSGLFQRQTAASPAGLSRASPHQAPATASGKPQAPADAWRHHHQRMQRNASETGRRFARPAHSKRRAECQLRQLDHRTRSPTWENLRCG